MRQTDLAIFKSAYDVLYALCLSQDIKSSIPHPSNTADAPIAVRDTNIWYKAIGDYKPPMFSNKVALKFGDLVLVKKTEAAAECKSFTHELPYNQPMPAY